MIVIIIPLTTFKNKVKHRIPGHLANFLFSFLMVRKKFSLVDFFSHRAIFASSQDQNPGCLAPESLCFLPTVGILCWTRWKTLVRLGRILALISLDNFTLKTKEVCSSSYYWGSDPDIFYDSKDLDREKAQHMGRIFSFAVLTLWVDIRSNNLKKSWDSKLVPFLYFLSEFPSVRLALHAHEPT